MSWAGKRVLVTGADGFIGSHLAERLATEGAKVRVFCLYNSQGSTGWLDKTRAEIRENFEVRLGDIRDAGLVSEACKNIEVIFHLAALVAIPYSYQAPESFYETNVRGTMNVLEGARRSKPLRLVHTSTSEVYGTPKTLPICETHPLNAQSPYAASKVAADQMCLAYRCSFGVPVTILRPFNTFGPRQSARAVTAAILSQLLHGRSEVLLGRIDTRRDLTFVSDVVEGFLRAGLAVGIDGEVIQLGTGRATSIEELFNLARDITRSHATVRLDERRLRPGESEVLVLQSDPRLASQRLDWKPTISLEEGLARTAAWMQDNLERYCVNTFQI